MSVCAQSNAVAVIIDPFTTAHGDCELVSTARDITELVIGVITPRSRSVIGLLDRRAHPARSTLQDASRSHCPARST
jgi:hypothetical protein